jgi:hypothetical protein
MSYVNRSSGRGLVQSFQGSEGKWRREIREVGWSEGRGLWQGDEVKFLVFMIIRRCGVHLGLDCNRLRVEVDLDFFLSWILTLDLPLCQEHQKEIKRSSIFILRTNTKEMMSELRILGMVVVVASSLTIWRS